MSMIPPSSPSVNPEGPPTRPTTPEPDPNAHHREDKSVCTPKPSLGLTRTSAMIFVTDGEGKISQYPLAEGVMYRDLPPVLKVLRNLVFDLDEIIPRLYLSGVVPALSAPTLEKYRITHVISVMNDPPNVIPTVSTAPTKDRVTPSPSNSPITESSRSTSSSLTFLKIPVTDTPSSDLRSHFPKALNFIASTLATDPDARILCHCYGGISRSATIVMAYLMSTRRLGVDEALEFVRSKRPQVRPNSGFMAQLKRWEKDAEERRIRKRKTFSPVAGECPSPTRSRKAC
ncbi:protein-tyrosine phosphatase-like protein [Cantharellus anzutake]|uniref:protein-tyrosine phosphatase-like protein n=1 Tax=Cantharellus anzutake TaxID=1750568 RepID=UPI0019047191|nr:protein-tyrosine phosphatase-like protein [Cantharellus anzutake]KAF8338035.1 protein-tyrosine phosphatase-like protein [Cantharellus anzutake]